ncbi:MAG: 3-hydroxyacyl-CoA dehydrogenase NAD-binding domain-containing protein [Pirellulaceae bacterium]|nr:3-hydroxyacyl-CoA dehydrogenase NAD-binding domain-containing protein [Pirellulaceae bacterium]
MNEVVKLTMDGEIGIITVDNPPVNSLGGSVPWGLMEGVRIFEQDYRVHAIVLLCAGRTFIVGADIRDVEQATSGHGEGFIERIRQLFEATRAFEHSTKPVVAAMHGTALGGGLEIAMACHYRVAVPSAQFGLPEAKIGLIPGGGGTQRLPRLAGVAKAAEMCATGEFVNATVAKQFGIIDAILEGDFPSAAVDFARKAIGKDLASRRTCMLPVKTTTEASIQAELDAVRAKINTRAKNLIAPWKAIEAVEAATRLPIADGLRFESQRFFDCLYSEPSKALVHMFFGEREVAKIPGIPKDTITNAIQRAAVVGAGTMGGGIAMCYANAGIPVLLKEVSQEALDRGLQTIAKNYAATVAKGRLTQSEMDCRLRLIEPTLVFNRFGEADIVVEAVFEGMELKKNVFAELDCVARPDAILATNTSTLDIDEIAMATSRPSQVIGHHFFSPANVMKLLEIVRGASTSEVVIAASMQLARRLGKVGVLVGNCNGFVGNRMFGPYQRESQFLLEEGAKVEEVDAVLEEFGMAMGPLAVSDLAGIDVCWRIRQESQHLYPRDWRDAVAIDRLHDLGRDGLKVGAGWYRYAPGSRVRLPDPTVEAVIAECAGAAGVQRRTVSHQEILERSLYALVNEAAKILDEGIALRAVDIDVIYVNGYGFPAHRGGPLWYADQVGLSNVYDKICEFRRQHGPWWEPAPLLQELASKKSTFADFDRRKKIAYEKIS